MKLDLEEIERKAVASKRKAFGQRVMIPADHALALTARIRELELMVCRCGNAFAEQGKPPSPFELIALLEKGAVLL